MIRQNVRLGLCTECIENASQQHRIHAIRHFYSSAWYGNAETIVRRAQSDRWFTTESGGKYLKNKTLIIFARIVDLSCIVLAIRMLLNKYLNYFFILVRSSKLNPLQLKTCQNP